MGSAAETATDIHPFQVEIPEEEGLPQEQTFGDVVLQLGRSGT